MSADKHLIGCELADVATPRIPSVILTCTLCGARLIVSLATLHDLFVQGVARENVEPRCMYTCMVVPDDSELMVTESVREELRAIGLTDEQINEAVTRMSFIVRDE